MQRPFASGSRQAPDPFDQYLEQEGFYRKHTARDSSCLFRTISEQMYDTQLLHLSIRQACVEYMRKHKNVFQQNIDKYIDEYLDEMSKPKTFGTLLELRAIAYLYRRNVILFEAFNTGTWMVREPGFTDVFRVFFTPEKHFDSVFPNEFIEVAAFCQSICYEILYKHVFKLPDVTYAVEQMLHANSFESVSLKSEYDGHYTRRILLDDGRVFDFDRPEQTSCILDNYKLCHFHNTNFTQFTDSLNQDMCLVENSHSETHRVTRTIDALLPEKYISCVRQLLNEGITPFPYKVAKALDPDIYRNIEFDAWSEMRKEQRFKNWYTGGSNFQVGVKCLVKLRNSQSDLYTCHIQEMSADKGPCLVYIEDLGEKHIVPYDYLQPLPSEQAKPWPLPFRYQKHIEKYPAKYIINELKKNQRNCGKNKAMEITHNYDIMKSSDIFVEDDCLNEKDDLMSKLKQYTTFQHFHPAPIEYLAMPLSVERRNTENSKSNRRNSDNSRASHVSCSDVAKQDITREEGSELEFAQPSDNYPYGYGYPQDSYYPYTYDSSIIHAGSHSLVPSAPPFYCMYNSTYAPNNSAVSQGVYVPPPMHCAQGPSGFYPPYFPVHPTSSSSNSYTATNTSNRRNASSSASNNRINYSAIKSEEESGSDLPKDVATLRYFYNLGCEYFKKKFGSNNGRETPSIENEEKRDDVNKITSDLQNNLKIEGGTTSANLQNKVDNNNNIPNNQGQNSRRFHSRYFNSKKDRQGYRAGNRFPATDPSKATGSKNNLNTSNIGNKSSSSNVASIDQGIQTSPASVATSDNNDCAQVTQIPYSTQTSVNPPPFIPVYSTEDQQSGVFVPQAAVMPVPCGVYAPPPHPAHGSTYPAYLGPPPTQSIPVPAPSYPPHAQPAFYPPSMESASVIGTETIENGHYAVMSYSPVYYSPNNAGAPTSGSVPQGYWYTALPPPLPVTTGNQTNPTNNTH